MTKKAKIINAIVITLLVLINATFVGLLIWGFTQMPHGLAIACGVFLIISAIFDIVMAIIYSKKRKIKKDKLEI